MKKGKGKCVAHSVAGAFFFPAGADGVNWLALKCAIPALA